MNKQDLFELVHVNTERKWEKIGNLNAVFNSVAADFCSRKRFWWRKVFITFQTVQGQGTYDLSAPGVVTNYDFSEVAIEEVSQVITVSVTGLASSGGDGFGFDFQFNFGGGGGGGGVTSGADLGGVTPIFDDVAIIGMINNPTPQGITRYAFGYNDDKTMIFDPVDGIYTVWAAVWAIPDAKLDSTSQAIPIIPRGFHDVIAAGMEAYIFEHAYGAANPKSILCAKRYEDGILGAMAKNKYSSNYSQQLVSSECAIRST